MEILLLWPVCILSGILIVLLRYSLWRKQYSQLVPSVTPSIYNIFGDLSEFWTFKDLHTRIMNKFMRRSKTFQKKGLMCFWAAYSPFVFLLKASTVKEVLKGSKMLDKGWMYKFLNMIVGDGLLTSSGVKWRFQKRMLTPCFHSDVVRNFIQTFNEESKNLVDILQNETKEEFTYINNKIALSFLDVASETIFGVPIGAMKDENLQHIKSLRRVADIFMTRVCSPRLWPDFIYKNTKLYEEMMHHKELMQEVTRNIIQEKRNRYLRGEKITLKGKRKAMLDLLLEKHFETKELSEEDIREQVDLFLIAGHETVGTTMTWTLFLLGHHPDIQAKVHEELDRVFGDDRERPATEEDIKDLQYLNCVIKESLRIYPGIPIFGREAPEDMEINGFPVPKGSALLIFAYALHRDEDVFPDPEKFEPDRFSPENSRNIPEFAYVPFSAGIRNCIGYKYADILLRVFLSWILRNFTVESLDPREKVLPILNVGLHPSKPIRIGIRSRPVPTRT